MVGKIKLIIFDIDGVLVDQEFNYTAKFPQYIHTNDTLKIIDRRPY